MVSVLQKYNGDSMKCRTSKFLVYNGWKLDCKVPDISEETAGKTFSDRFLHFMEITQYVYARLVWLHLILLPIPPHTHGGY